MRCSPDTRRNAGFTLIEVMAAGMILSVLALGLSNLWAVVGERSIDATLRQKAVLVLNGEMERLAALYNLTGFGASTAADTSGYGADAAFADDRVIYRASANSFMAGAGDAFVADRATFLAGPDALVLLEDATGDAADRNYVWIDRPRGILGRLSWAETDIDDADCSGGGAGSCLCYDWSGGAGGVACREIALYLEYPFRLTGTAVAEAADRTEALPLKTIVGRWR